jgi:hypothetical protein
MLQIDGEKMGTTARLNTVPTAECKREFADRMFVEEPPQ